MNKHASILVLSLLVWTSGEASYSELVELSQYSNLRCGRSLSNNAVELVELQDMLHDKKTAVELIQRQFPDHGLESPIPLLRSCCGAEITMICSLIPPILKKRFLPG